MLKICQRQGLLPPPPPTHIPSHPMPILRHHQPGNVPLSTFQSWSANQSLSDGHVHFSTFRHSSAFFHSPIMLPVKNTSATESRCHFASHKIRVSILGSIPILAFALEAKKLHLINSRLCPQTCQPTSTSLKGSFPDQHRFNDNQVE